MREVLTQYNCRRTVEEVGGLASPLQSGVAVKIVTKIGKITHRAQLLVDVGLECGCILTYEFEFESGHAPTDKHAIPVRGVSPYKGLKGWWVPTLTHPGEVTEGCGTEQCSISDRSVVKKEGLEMACEYIKTNISPEAQLQKLLSGKQ